MTCRLRGEALGPAARNRWIPVVLHPVLLFAIVSNESGVEGVVFHIRRFMDMAGGTSEVGEMAPIP